MADSKTSASGMRRRDLLKLGAAGGAVAWAAPAIYTSRAYAAGTLSSDLCVCRDEDGKKTSTRKITSITIEWNAGDCTEPSAQPRCQYPGEPPQSNVVCTGDSTGVASATIRSGSKASGNCAIATAYQIRKATDPAPTDQTGATSVDVTSGEDFTVYFPTYFPGGSNAATPNLAVEISWTVEGVTRTQTVCFHTSCSQSLCFGDEFGPLVVKSYTVTPTNCP